jgi:hypothetical protein
MPKMERIRLKKMGRSETRDLCVILLKTQKVIAKTERVKNVSKPFEGIKLRVLGTIQHQRPIYFHFLGLFMTKKHDLSDKKFSGCHAPLPLQKFVSTLAQSL